MTGTSGRRARMARATAAWPTYTSALASDVPVDHADEDQREQEQQAEAPRAELQPRRDAEQVKDDVGEAHSGVRCGATSRAGIAERRAGGELRAATPAERVHPHAARRHVAVDRTRGDELRR